MLTCWLDCPCTITHKTPPPYTTTTTYCPPASSSAPHYHHNTTSVITVYPPPKTTISGTTPITHKTPVAPTSTKPAVVTAAAHQVAGSMGGMVVAGLFALML